MDGREVQGHRAKKKRGRALHAWQPAKSGEGRAGGRLESRGRGGGRWLQWVAAAAAMATAAAGTACDGSGTARCASRARGSAGQRAPGGQERERDGAGELARGSWRGRRGRRGRSQEGRSGGAWGRGRGSGRAVSQRARPAAAWHLPSWGRAAAAAPGPPTAGANYHDAARPSTGGGGEGGGGVAAAAASAPQTRRRTRSGVVRADAQGCGGGGAVGGTHGATGRQEETNTR